ncbi:hypothetical protein LCGC14_1973250 [marine sediment metagenome]|uniref:Uncharacterized protein n=1 Tax=marine sediment metagenome TaxID=412755 RepID=A0A0F9FB27_9ZZZZ
MITTESIIVFTIKAHKTCVAIMDAEKEVSRTDPEYERLCKARQFMLEAVYVLKDLLMERPDCDDWIMDFPNERAKPAKEKLAV